MIHLKKDKSYVEHLQDKYKIKKKLLVNLMNKAFVL